MKTVNISDFAKYVGLSLLSKELSVSHLKLQKILYYCQAWHMVFFGRENTLFAEKPQAWVNGPVYPSIYNEYKDKTETMRDHLKLSDFYQGSLEDGFKEYAEKMNFEPDEAELLESIILLYGEKSQNHLVFFTHTEKPWTEKREGLKPFERSTAELSLDTMYSYYKERHESNRRNETHIS